MRIRNLCIGFLAATSLSQTVPAFAASTTPYFASLGSDRVYLRQGPTYQNKILWVYHRKGLPVEVLERYLVWRRVRMPDGAIGWIHVAMLSPKRTLVVTVKAPVHDGTSPHAPILALAAPGVIAKLDHCGPAACEVSVAGIDGWIAKKSVWGVTPGEKAR
jgi:SH3-like domain-containing protein